ncbi:O-antigen/teichoic acid export membrane protein [Arthrobacter sp. UYP6]|uniref:hypothetical protein n=1 Tax=Arthrobacter sp. UYP6 TaxID=1756378 RepID=UPI0033912FE9
MGQASAAGVGAASLASAAVGYIVIVVAARTLDKQDNAAFLTFWSVVFLVIGVLGGIAVETTRAARTSRSLEASAPADAGTPGAGRRPRMGWVALAVGLATGVLLAAASPLWAPPIFGSYASALVPVVCVTAVFYAGHAVMMGQFGGIGRWGTYSRLIASESAVRLAVLVAVVLIGATVAGLAWATAAGTAAWLLFMLLSPQSRRAFLFRADTGLRPYLRTVWHACMAAAASASLVVGFPVLLRLTTSDAVYLESAALLMALSLTRAPLMIPLQAYQGVAITHFMSRRSEGLKAVAPIFGLVIGVAALGAAAAWLLGPWLMVAFFGDHYNMSGAVLAALTFDAGFLALLTLTGALTIASNRHRAYSLGWITACLVSFAMLWLPLDIETRTIISLAAGPLCGIAVHLLVIIRSSPSASATGGTQRSTPAS